VMINLPRQNVRRALLAITIAYSFIVFGYSQQPKTSGGSLDDVRLPGYFSRFSKNDVFAAVFADFDKSTGRVPHILDKQKQPSLVRLDQARLWLSGGQNYLVVMIDLGGYDEQFGIPVLCGNCLSASPIAVLRAVGDRLELVAKQDDDFYQSLNGEDRSTSYEAFWYTGHDYDVTFDLAPYRLNNKELLIGVRYQHMWVPATSFSTTLLLYRIEGNRISKVFEDLVVDRSWQNGPARHLKMEKTTSVLMSVPTKGPFNQLVAVRKTHKCIANRDTYDCVGGALLKTYRETWQFDGTRFVKTGNNERED